MYMTNSPRDLNMWIDRPDSIVPVPLRESIEVDIAILGGGFTGLSAAYHLKRNHPELSIAIVESHCVGSGASGRNTGILRPGVGRSLKQSIRKFGEQDARQLYQFSVDSVRYVKELIQKEQLQCSWEDVPHAKTAMTQKQALALKEEYKILKSWGQNVEYLDGKSMTQEAPRVYAGGLCYHDSGTINPALLCRELKRVIIALGVKVFERSPVTNVQSKDRVQVTTEGGEVVAKRAIMATNGYVSQLGVLAGRVLPLQTHVCVTEPLSETQIEQLGWNHGWTIADKRNLFNYYRLTPDRRFMFGGGKPLYARHATHAQLGAVDVAQCETWSSLRRGFEENFPSLKNAVFVYQWSGTLGMTLQEIPLLAEVPQLPGVCFLGGWSGHGVATATASGAMLADYVLGDASRVPPRWKRSLGLKIPGDPLRSWVLATHLKALEWVDRFSAMVDGYLNHSDQKREKTDLALAERALRHSRMNGAPSNL